VGSPAFTSIEVFAFKGRYSVDLRKGSLINFSFVNIESLTPAHSYQVPLSWALKVGAERVTDKNHCIQKEGCVAGVVRIGGGGTVELFSKISLSLLGDYEFMASSELKKSSQRHSVGPRLIVYRPLFENFSFLYDLKVYYHFIYEKAWSLNHDFAFNFKVSKNIDSQLQVSLNDLSREVSFGLRYFF
ncbi:MAG: hypothetical protein WCK43_09780, partial [bacterium]